MNAQQRETLKQLQLGYDYTEYEQRFHPIGAVTVVCYLGSDRLKYQTTVTIYPDGSREAKSC